VLAETTGFTALSATRTAVVAVVLAPSTTGTPLSGRDTLAMVCIICASLGVPLSAERPSDDGGTKNEAFFDID
jgi:hypothetical protein